MRLFGKKMDERERAEMYKNEHYAFWLLYCGQAISLIARGIFLGESFWNHAWEWGVFLAVSIWLVISDMRRGNYDYYTEPGWKSYLAYSLGFSLLFDAVSVAAGIYKGWIVSVRAACIAGMVEFVFLFALCYAGLAVCGTLSKRRRKKLEEELDDEE